MSVRLVIDGLDDLRRALQRLPDDLTDEASRIVTDAAELAKAAIVQGYPIRSGSLRNHVTLSHFSGGRYSAGALVKNTAPHAWIFENGTQARHTAIGADRGAMPPGHVFIPAAVRHRRGMYAQLRAMLERHGLQVTGYV